MQYIYSRVSTDKQDNDNQLSKLRELYPNALVIEEVASGAKARPLLTGLVESLVNGDELIISALDRLGRKTTEIILLIEQLTSRGVILKSLREGIDYSTPTGKLITQILCAFAELERNLISQRTRDALSAKRRQGIIGGRRRTVTLEQIAQIKQLRKTKHTMLEIEALTGIKASAAYEYIRPKKNRRTTN